jgi:acyl-CoA reductase-like NAD-dependent aldehyde dehydrogenase
MKLDVEALRAPMQATHDSGINLSYEWRRKQLIQLSKVSQHHDEIRAALFADLGKESTEVAMSEICILDQEIQMALDNLKSWMAPEEVASPLVAVPAFTRIEKRPLLAPGCLIIGPFNYPWSLSLLPVIGCLAAGNPAVSASCIATRGTLF